MFVSISVTPGRNAAVGSRAAAPELGPVRSR
jgi:hypothetical protein